MLRASIDETGAEFDITAVTGKTEVGGDIAEGELLAGYAEAITARDEPRTAEHRARIANRLGEAAMIDATAVAAAFHGFVRVADATGAPPEGAAGGRVTMEFREHVGINDFYGAKNT